MQIAKVQRVYYSGYADILISGTQNPCNGLCDVCDQVSLCPVFSKGCKHYMAENVADANWNDIVEIEHLGEEGGGVNIALLLPYLTFALAFVLGCLITGLQGQAITDMAVAGAMLGVMAFVLVWLFTRSARLEKRVQYQIVRVLYDS